MKEPVFEDTNVMDYNKWVKGIASREFSSNKVFLNSLYDNQREKQYPNKSKAQNVLPYPMTNLVPTIGNALISLQSSISIIKNLINNPLVKNETNASIARSSIECLAAAADKIKEAANFLDKITTVK